MQVDLQHKNRSQCIWLLYLTCLLLLMNTVNAQNFHNWNWVDTFNHNSIVATPDNVIKTADNHYLVSYYQIHDGGDLVRNYYFKFSLVNQAGLITQTITIEKDSFYDMQFITRYGRFANIVELDSFYFFSSAVQESTGKPCMVYAVIDKQFTGYRIGNITYTALTDSFEFEPSDITVKYNKHTNQFYGVNRLWSTNKPKPYHIYQVNILMDPHLNVLNNTVSITTTKSGSKQDVVYSPATKRYYSIDLFNDSIVLDSMMNTLSIRNTSFWGVYDIYETNFQAFAMPQSFIEYNEDFILSGIWYKYFGQVPADPFGDYYYNYYYAFKRFNKYMQLVDSTSILPIPEDSAWRRQTSNLSDPMIPSNNVAVSYINPNHIYFAYYSYSIEGTDSSWYVLGVLDSTLKLKWVRKFYQHTSRVNITSILATDDGGCLVLGNNTINSNNYFYEIDIYIAKHEADGRITSVQQLAQGKPQSLIYPNPTHGFIYVSGNKAPVKATAINLLGQATALPAADFTVDARTLSNGVYILQLFDTTGDLISSQKIIKQ